MSIIDIYVPAEKEIVCQFTKDAITIDGRLNEDVWETARLITIKDQRNRTTNKMTVRTLWDKDNLYMSFDIKDKDLQAKQNLLDHPKLYLDDMVEFLIDTKNDKDSCWGLDDIVYHINLFGQKKDDRGSVNCITDPSWNGNAKYVVTMSGTLNDPSDEDVGYVLEVAISWKELDLAPKTGSRIGIDFATGDSGKLFDWVGVAPFRSPYAFGTLILSKNYVGMLKN